MSAKKNIKKPDFAFPRLSLVSSTFFQKLFFFWIDPLMNQKDKTKISFEDMADLPENYTHERYSVRLKYFCEKHLRELKKSAISTRQKKLFMIKLIFACFKWDILLIFFLVLFEKILIFSASFFVQKILEIPESYFEYEFFDAFLFYIVLLLLVKTLFSVVTENIKFYIVF